MTNKKDISIREAQKKYKNDKEAWRIADIKVPLPKSGYFGHFIIGFFCAGISAYVYQFFAQFTMFNFFDAEMATASIGALCGCLVYKNKSDAHKKAYTEALYELERHD